MSEDARDLIAAGHSARREDRDSDALAAFSRAVELAREADERTLIAALEGVGQLERDRGRLDAARGAYGEAAERARETGDPILLAHTLRHLGDVERQRGNAEAAEPLLREALSLYRDRQLPSPLDLANAIRPMALLYEALDDPGEARRLWAEARDLYAASHVGAGVEECEAHLADLMGGD